MDMKECDNIWNKVTWIILNFLTKVQKFKNSKKWKIKKIQTLKIFH